MISTVQKHTVLDWRLAAKAVAKKLKETAIERDRKAGVPDYEVNLLREAGLLPLIVPELYGGLGSSWIDAMDTIKELAKGDSATAQLYGYHVLLSATPQLSGTPEQAEAFYRETAQHHLFWANAINIRDARLSIVSDGDHYRVNGVKSFCTGAAVADRIICTAIESGNPLPVLFVLPRDRTGLTYNHDWNVMGQRRTASGSFTFDHVAVKATEILGPPADPEGAAATLLGMFGLLLLSHIFLGIAEGALESAMDYTRAQSRPWLTSGVDKAVEDPHLLRHYGKLWTQLQGAKALAGQATAQAQWAWDKGNALTHEERGKVAIAAAAAKSLATDAGLAITNRIFEMMGARSAAACYDFDRYWRDLRTLSLHDPLDYKLQEIGDWVLNGKAPVPTPYA
ncbi:Acyl-CoA dehydrogenase, C-terminal domain protein [Synechococcus sp. PCC 7335]|uniref:acyl-CoA dehydrogenase family protein n=1 Tax=Synechococcus sp. (strain ATCC 29403 / PCC 7335) TaxID=91464 RepID=UPI00017EC0A0|nr:acyl-CoA dehydrogenase family protein [Synechococcus sp. PCC 7335]EDX83402.1 Acyl-CoA dehydrogenase, C-terminal domain protein [Synechococcus sp. PCC 7335]